MLGHFRLELPHVYKEQNPITAQYMAAINHALRCCDFDVGFCGFV